MTSGFFVVFEGPDGSGKSSAAASLAAHLQTEGKEALVVREPGGTAVGEQIRKILLTPEFAETRPGTELLLFMAARAQLCQEIIKPALEAGKIVISDRFVLSSLVYQGIAGGLEKEEILAVAAVACAGIIPQLTLVIDVPAATGLARIKGECDRIERKGLEFHKTIRAGFLQVAGEMSQCQVIDGTQTIEAVKAEVWKEFKRVFK